MRLKSIVLTALLVLGLTAMGYAEEIKVNGSTTVLPIIQCAVEKYMAAHPDVKMSVSGTGSGDGIKALIDGSCDIAMASRKMKDKEKTLAEKHGVSPVELVIAGDALLPVAHPSNSIESLSKDELKAIYKGDTTEWAKVGGPDKPIAVHSRESSSGTFATWNKKVLGKDRLTPRAQTVTSNGAMVQAVAKNPNAIGYIGIGYADKQTKNIAVGGVVGSAETVADGSYPFGRTLQLYTNGAPKGAVKGFLDWLMADGQGCIDEVGFLRLK